MPQEKLISLPAGMENDIVFTPGTRVLAFDSTLYKDDVTTPLSMTMKPATVVKWYGTIAEYYSLSELTLGPYGSLVDVKFDHRPERISRGHFTQWFGN